MKSVATDLRRDLEARFESAVVAACERVLGTSPKRVEPEDSERCKERLACCTITFFGDDWIAAATLMTARAAVESNARVRFRRAPHEKMPGCELAEVLGELAVEAAQGFGASFFCEDALVIGPPVTVFGDAAAVVNPENETFETRLTFAGDGGAFWAVLRLDAAQQG